MSNSVINATAVMLIGTPILPRWKGPGGKYLRPDIKLATKGIAYDTVVKMINEPVRLRKAVGLPSGMAPSPVATTADADLAKVSSEPFLSVNAS